MNEFKMINLLKKSWEATCSIYTNDIELIKSLFDKIIEKYQEPHRHYHNCQHIMELLQLIDQFTEEDNRDIHIFTAFFHDVIYEPGRADNEIRSAEFAIASMRKLSVPTNIIDAVEQIILATQTHEWFDVNVPN